MFSPMKACGLAWYSATSIWSSDTPSGRYSCASSDKVSPYFTACCEGSATALVTAPPAGGAEPPAPSRGLTCATGGGGVPSGLTRRV